MSTLRGFQQLWKDIEELVFEYPNLNLENQNAASGNGLKFMSDLFLISIFLITKYANLYEKHVNSLLKA